MSSVISTLKLESTRFRVKANSTTYYANLQTTNLTSTDRTFEFPDNSGTLALLSDMGSYLPLALTSNTTISNSSTYTLTFSSIENLDVIGKYNTNTTYAQRWFNSDLGTPIFAVRNDGAVLFSSTINASSGVKFIDVPNRLIYAADGTSDRIDIENGALYFSGSIQLDWKNRILNNDWKISNNGNLSIGGTPSYGGGANQYFQAESTSPSATTPTGGIRKQIVNGAEFILLPNGNTICTSGNSVIAQTGNITQSVGDEFIEYTGTGGHTLNLHTFSGYVGNKIIVKNNGTGVLTVDPNSTETIDGSTTITLSPGESRIIKVLTSTNATII
jgi:hypothetical protein